VCKVDATEAIASLLLDGAAFTELHGMELVIEAARAVVTVPRVEPYSDNLVTIRRDRAMEYSGRTRSSDGCAR
jgi:hypothetical protein